MIPNKKPRVLKTLGTGVGTEFGISRGDEAHIMVILRDTLYSDRIKAVLREYSTNAWDEHRESGKPNVPIKVTLPTPDDPTLSIRDFGRGLSEDDVLKVYSQYGASTKRNSDNSVGFLGIGSKSAFAYSDSFTITSFFNGEKSMYVAVLTKDEKGRIDLLQRIKSDEEPGVLIQVAVRQEDIWEFKQKAQKLFMYFQPRPTINADIPRLPTVQANLKNGVLYDLGSAFGRRDDGWSAIMGCISYDVDLKQLSTAKFVEGDEEGEDEEGGAKRIALDGEAPLPDYLRRLSGALYFGIGEVAISASREELKYTDDTKKLLREKINSVVDEYVQNTLDGIRNGGFSRWEQRVRAQVLHDLQLPVPAEYKSLTNSYVDLRKDDMRKAAPKSLEIFCDHLGKKHAESISIHAGTRFILKDDSRNIYGYSLGAHDYLVRKLGKKATDTWDIVIKDLEAYVELMDLKGVPIVSLSTLPWSERVRHSGKQINPKHHKKVFKLVESGYSSIRSNNWESIQHTPGPNDVFVILSYFETKEFDSDFDIYNLYREDSEMAEAFGGTMPDIIGYKYTEKKPIKVTDCVGKYYPEWRKEFAKSLLKPETLKLMKWWGWARMRGDLGHLRYDKISGKEYQRLSKSLGVRHKVTVMARNYFRALQFFKKGKNSHFIDHIEALYELVKDSMILEADKDMAELAESYPLLTIEGFELAQLWGEDSDKWCHYIKSMDQLAKAKVQDVPAVLADQRIDHCGVSGEVPRGAEGSPAVQCPPAGDHPGGLGERPQPPDGGEEPGGVVQGQVHV